MEVAAEVDQPAPVRTERLGLVRVRVVRVVQRIVVAAEVAVIPQQLVPVVRELLLLATSQVP
jgi:hypothetical protein